MMCKGNPDLITQHNLNVLSFNVEGLSTISDDPDFNNLLDKHDVCLLTETWRKEDTKLNLEGFWDFSQIRPKHRKAFRHSGGITVFVKHHIKPGIRVALSTEGFVWLKLDKHFFQFANDVYLCTAYIPPQYTCKNIHAKTDYFQSLIDSCFKYSCLGNIVIAGDLNARIGNDLLDEAPSAQVINDLLPDESSDYASCQRSSCDTVTNSFGKKLKDLCHGFNLQIANGMVPGDRLGNFTCFNRQGTSVVDYIITDKGFYNNISKMNILSPEYSSVHAPISVSIRCKVVSEEKSSGLLPPPPKFIWNPDKAKHFGDLLNQPETQDKLYNLQERLQSNESKRVEQIDYILKDLSELLYENAQKCLRLRKKVNKKPRDRSKPLWFDRICLETKKRFRNLAKLLQKNPKDPYICGKYLLVKKEYKRLLKDSKSKFEIDSINKLN